jgi:hypothetical protein
MKALTLLVLCTLCALAQTQPAHPDAHHEAVNERGEAHQGMGFSQTETTHHFILTPNGGYIQVTANDPRDRKNIEQVQMHFSHIAKSFAQGDFSIPHFVHDQTPPGVKTMQELKRQIKYSNQKLENGAKLVISTSSPQGIEAIHDFLRFQISDHQTGDPTTVAGNK